MGYPEHIDGKPPVLSLKEYDQASWASTTCIDRKDGDYVVVDMQTPTQIVARVSSGDNDTLDQIFQSAHQDYAKQIAEDNVQRK